MEKVGLSDCLMKIWFQKRAWFLLRRLVNVAICRTTCSLIGQWGASIYRWIPVWLKMRSCTGGMLCGLIIDVFQKVSALLLPQVVLSPTNVDGAASSLQNCHINLDRVCGTVEIISGEQSVAVWNPPLCGLSSWIADIWQSLRIQYCCTKFWRGRVKLLIIWHLHTALRLDQTRRNNYSATKLIRLLLQEGPRV